MEQPRWEGDLEPEMMRGGGGSIKANSGDNENMHTPSTGGQGGAINGRHLSSASGKLSLGGSIHSQQMSLTPNNLPGSVSDLSPNPQPDERGRRLSDILGGVQHPSPGLP